MGGKLMLEDKRLMIACDDSPINGPVLNQPVTDKNSAIMMQDEGTKSDTN